MATPSAASLDPCGRVVEELGMVQLPCHGLANGFLTADELVGLA